MAIKEDLKEEVKEEGGGKDELDALEALEKEAKEYDKVCSYSVFVSMRLTTLLPRMLKSIESFNLSN